MQFKDYYQILGVNRDAKADDIKRAYRRLARKYHPDVSKEADAEVRFKEMKEAYEVLKDPEKRSAYDTYGANWKAGQDYQPPPGGHQHRYSTGQQGFQGDGDFSDFFESLFGSRSSRGGYGTAGTGDGNDINARIRISLEDAFNGATRQISLELPETDEHGTTRRRQRTLNVRIPKGIANGQRIRLEGQGGAGFGPGARRGDLFLEVQIDNHPTFKLEGHNIHVTLPISDWEAALGAKVKAPTLGGSVDLKIPAGSSSGKRLRLKGRGMPGKTTGDQYVELMIVLPAEISDKARALYEQLKTEQSFNPRAAAGA
jgi:curved DNA-binding protein